MKTTKNEAVTSNIPSTGFNAKETQHYCNTRIVEFNANALFSFSFFSVRQMLLGEPIHRTHNTEEDELFRKMAFYALEIGNTNDAQSNCCIYLRRDEILLLRKWLEARMAHCEKEREERIPLGTLLASAGKVARAESSSYDEAETFVQNQKFNPDTYIAMKYLLLDIREWLLGEITE